MLTIGKGLRARSQAPVSGPPASHRRAFCAALLIGCTGAVLHCTRDARLQLAISAPAIINLAQWGLFGVPSGKAWLPRVVVVARARAPRPCPKHAAARPAQKPWERAAREPLLFHIQVKPTAASAAGTSSTRTAELGCRFHAMKKRFKGSAEQAA